MFKKKKKLQEELLMFSFLKPVQNREHSQIETRKPPKETKKQTLGCHDDSLC